MKNIFQIFLFLLISYSLNSQKIDSFFSKDGTEIFYEEFGSKGKTIVLLSGLGLTRRTQLHLQKPEFLML